MREGVDLSAVRAGEQAARYRWFGGTTIPLATGTVEAMPRLYRDSMTWLIYVQLGIWGYFLYGFGPVVPLLRDEQHVSRTVASLHSTALAVGGALGGAAFPYLRRRFGRGPRCGSACSACASA